MPSAPISSSSLSIGTATRERAPASLATAELAKGSVAARSGKWINPLRLEQAAHRRILRSGSPAHVDEDLRTRAGAPYIATTRNLAALRRVPDLQNLASQMRVAFAQNDLEYRLQGSGRTRDDAQHLGRRRLCFRRSIFACAACGSRMRPTRVLAFVPVERSLRPCVRLFAPLRDRSPRWHVGRPKVPRTHAPKTITRQSELCVGV